MWRSLNKPNSCLSSGKLPFEVHQHHIINNQILSTGQEVPGGSGGLLPPYTSLLASTEPRYVLEYRMIHWRDRGVVSFVSREIWEIRIKKVLDPFYLLYQRVSPGTSRREEREIKEAEVHANSNQ